MIVLQNFMRVIQEMNPALSNLNRVRDYFKERFYRFKVNKNNGIRILKGGLTRLITGLII